MGEKLVVYKFSRLNLCIYKTQIAPPSPCLRLTYRYFDLRLGIEAFWLNYRLQIAKYLKTSRGTDWINTKFIDRGLKHNNKGVDV